MAYDLTLKIAILKSGKSQIVIAKKAGIDNTKLSKIVHGHREPSDDERRAIARVLRRPVSELFPSSEVSTS